MTGYVAAVCGDLPTATHSTCQMFLQRRIEYNLVLPFQVHLAATAAMCLQVMALCDVKHNASSEASLSII